MVCIGVILSLHAGSAGLSSPKVVAVPQTVGKIVIDGRLDEREWQKAARIRSFEHYMRKGELRNQTEVLLLYDSAALYVAYKCREADVPAVKANVTEHDGGVWNDDCVEIFLDPSSDRAGFLHFITNTVGTKYDALGKDSYGYNPSWEAKGQVGPDGWTVEIRLPFSELGVGAPGPGDSWLGNFCREEHPAGELSCWSPTMGSFDAPGAFGEIVFGSLAKKVRADIDRADRLLAGLEAAAGPEHELLVEARTSLAAARALLSKGSELSEKDYVGARAILERADRATGKLRAILRRAEMGNPDYLVWEICPWKHYSAEQDISGVSRDAERVEALTLAGQVESKALMLSNLTDETLSARLRVENLPADAVEILLPAFVRTADGRPFPDALIPSDPVGQLIVPPGETRQIWLNFRGAKAGNYEGTLTISPLTASKVDKQVKLSLEVVQPPMKLPRPLAFTWDYLGDAAALDLEHEYVGSMVEHGIMVFLVSGLRHMPRPRADDTGELLEPMDWSKFRRVVALKWRPGRKLYITMDVWEKRYERKIYNGKFNSPGWRAAFKKVIKEMATELRGLGLSYDDYMVNPVDESVDERYMVIARLVREADPNIRIVADTVGANLEQVKAADEVTDYWIPHFKAYLAEGCKEQIAYLKSTAKPLGFYYYSEGANEKAQYPYRHYLWKFWYAYSRGLDGIFGYWTATQHYGNPWNRHQTQALYDPSLFYYGNGCVVSGRRWEAWRRGIQDFALLRLCESIGVDGSLLSRAAKSVLDSPNDPDAAALARERLIRALAALPVPIGE